MQYLRQVSTASQENSARKQRETESYDARTIQCLSFTAIIGKYQRYKKGVNASVSCDALSNMRAKFQPQISEIQLENVENRTPPLVCDICTALV